MSGPSPTTAPLTLTQLVQFLEPRFNAVERRFDTIDEQARTFRLEVQERFDDLYKKFEMLYQEYLVANEQARRFLNSAVPQAQFQSALAELKAKLNALQQQVESLEQRS